MSALSLLARGENKFVKLGEHDTVILSSHAIPGNESNVNRVIDGLLRRRCRGRSTRGVADVHATGHAQADEIKTYLSIVQPEWFVPIHGEYRHMVANARARRADGRPARPRAAVRGRRRARAHRRRPRRTPVGCRPATCTSTASSATSARACSATAGCSAEEGVVVVVVTVDMQTGKVLTGPEIITRGWVYAPEAEDLLDEACDAVAAAVETALDERRARRRSARARRPPRRRQVRQRAHQAAADDRARRHGGVSRRRRGAARPRALIAAISRLWRVDDVSPAPPSSI